jgi:thiol-disulfide isomerase/thioredoxin
MRNHKLTLADDPTLEITGMKLIKFLQTRDEGILTNDLVKSIGEMWEGNQKSAANTGRMLPPREEFEKGMLPYWLDAVHSGRELLAQLDKAGVKLADSTMRLKDALADKIYPRGVITENLDCQRISFVLEVAQSSNKTPSGKPIIGQYIVAGGNALRSETRWAFMGTMRWQSMPANVLDEKANRALEFENYVAEHRALPPGTPIPDVEVISISDGKKLKLPELKKGATILEFWATWCGPCQEPMAKLQKMWEKHPEWKDRVAIVTVSIDDAADLPRKHMDKHGWTNSVATWVGEGDWKSAPAKAFRISGVPTCYVFDKDGKVVASGHPEGIEYESVVARTLK